MSATPTNDSKENNADGSTSSFSSSIGPLASMFRSTPSSALAELAPQLMQHRIINSPSFRDGSSSSPLPSSSNVKSLPPQNHSVFDRFRMVLPSRRGHPQSAAELAVIENVAELLAISSQESENSTGSASHSRITAANDSAANEATSAPGGTSGHGVSLIDGFNAIHPADSERRRRRRRRRQQDSGSYLGLGTVDEFGQEKGGGSGSSGRIEWKDNDAAANGGVMSVAARKHRVIGRKSLMSSSSGHRAISSSSTATTSESSLSNDPVIINEMLKEASEDREAIEVRKSLITTEIERIDRKISALDSIRQELKRGLMDIREEGLELDDEIVGLRENIKLISLEAEGKHVDTFSTRRRKGPIFLPDEHDLLPPNVAFMTIHAHSGPISALDYSGPYGTLVTASSVDEGARVWDLTTGQQTASLDADCPSPCFVKCLQVEENMCITGSDDGSIRIWNLDKAEENAAVGDALRKKDKSDNTDEEEDRDAACTGKLSGHTKAITSLYFDGNCLVTGSSDKTLRQWDLVTGQLVMTMDILWALSNQGVEKTNSWSSPGGISLKNSRRLSSQTYLLPREQGDFGMVAPPSADGSWDVYEDYVGGVQFWGYALSSGSADGCVRMWDMRTGQAHRTLVGHTAPVTSLQFDERHMVSGSLDKTVRIWDLRSGGVLETLRYDHGVTAVQFDSRRVVAAAGENGIRVFNRTAMLQQQMSVGGHTGPAERLRFMDRYMVSGGRDARIKAWTFV